MSVFDKITDDFTPKTLDVVITHKGVDYTFTAKEMSYLDTLSIGLKKAAGEDWFVDLIVAAIVDKDGKHMTIEQAHKLSAEHANKFVEAALAVNKGDIEEKK